MILHRLGLVNKNQRGFGIVELMLVLGISGIVAGAATATIFQIFDGSARSSNHMTAIKQVQNAGQWVSCDTQMAQDVYTENLTNPEDILELTWADWADNSEHEVVYSLQSMPAGGLKRLQRSYADGTDEGTIFVARNIDPTTTSCNLTEGELIFTVTAVVGSGSQEARETRVYKIVPRPGS